MRPIVVRAPATSANLGSGFDCLGLALDLWNEVTAMPGGAQVEHPDNLILRSARVVFDGLGLAYPGFELQNVNRIPFGRGLGSSSAAIACGILIANTCLGQPLDQAGLLELATRIEGHPDNVAPCLLGGARVATVDDNGTVIQVQIPLGLQLETVLFVPDQTVPTSHARGALPVSVPRADAVFNIARASLMVAGLAAGRADVLAEATRDRLHQQYRLPFFPPGATLLETAMQSGALGAYVSGAGPTVVALCVGESAAASVAAGFDVTSQNLKVPGSTLRLTLTDRGAHVLA